MTAYYNEHDRFAAAWLRELIAAGHLPAGDVDERDIQDVVPTDLDGYDQCHFFAGIGGWPYALRRAGWPDEQRVWTGSCPCQPFSQAGKGAGVDDERHLWPDFRWLIDQCRPPVIFGEQVASKDGRSWLAGVRFDLEAMAYAIGAADLCAAGAGENAEGWLCRGDQDFGWQRIVLGAPNIRQRLFWMAHAEGIGGRLPIRQAPREAAYPVRCGETDGLGNTARFGGHPGNDDANTALRNEGAAGKRSADSCGMDDAGSIGCGARWDRNNGGDDGFQPVANVPDDDRGMGNTAGERREGQPQRQLGPSDQGFWTDFDCAPCIDGKARRVEPGTFPLAHGVPARVGRLRGYGNAINPEIATQFITASIDAMKDTSGNCPERKE